jgi:hypothetical protein
MRRLEVLIQPSLTFASPCSIRDSARLHKADFTAVPKPTNTGVEPLDLLEPDGTQNRSILSNVARGTPAMKIKSVGHYGNQLTRFGTINCFLVHEDDGYTLIDANLKGSEEDILKADNFTLEADDGRVLFSMDFSRNKNPRAKDSNSYHDVQELLEKSLKLHFFQIHLEPWLVDLVSAVGITRTLNGKFSGHSGTVRALRRAMSWRQRNTTFSSTQAACRKSKVTRGSHPNYLFCTCRVVSL